MTKKEMEIMEANIRNYSKEIKTIEDFVEAVRKTIGQYLGYTGNKGFMNMVREIFQNSIDELMKDDSPCNHIILSYDERNHLVIVEDNGRGLPFGDIIRIFTAQHTSSNYTKKEGQFSSGRHGVGSKVTNAASSTFTARSYILGEARMVEFIDGKPKDKEPVVISNAENKQGTVIQFVPCYEVMGEITTTYQEVLGLVKLLLPLLKIGAVVDFNGIDSKGRIYTERLVNEDGIITDLINKTTAPLIPPIILSKLTGIMKADIAFTYDSSDLMIESITAFSNFCPTLSGTHVDGFLDGLTKFFREYMNKTYLTSNKLIVANNDIKTGLKCIISVAHLEPLFTGQAKEILSNDDMKWFVRQLVLDGLDQWSKENPASFQKLCKYYKDVAEIRVKSDDNKTKLSVKYQSSVLTGLPKKFLKPNGKKNLELLLLEGDSALGSGKNSRCAERQGLMPLRGKIPNAFSTDKTKFLNNEEINGVLAIIGCGYGKNFDISKCIWEKIIILCFTGGTKVKLLNGTTKTFEELVEMEKQNPGQTYWVYSYDRETGKYVPGAAHSPRITRYTDIMAKVTLDNGEVIECTPDHPFLTKDNEYVQAQFLQPGDSLMPLYSKMASINGETSKDPSLYREFIYTGNQWELTYHVMAEYAEGKPEDQTGYDRHHKDFNKNNNEPVNLEWLTGSEHGSIHSFTEYNKSDSHKKRVKELHAQGHYENMYFHNSGYNESEQNKESIRILNQRDDIKTLQIRGKIIRMGATLIKDGISLFPDMFTGVIYKDLKSKGYVLFTLDTILENFIDFEEFDKLCCDYELNEKDYNYYHQRDLKKLSEASYKTKRSMILKIAKYVFSKGYLVLSEDVYNTAKKIVASRAPRFKSIKDYFTGPQDFNEALALYNHTVVNVEICKLQTPIPMYDMTVPEYSNFTISTSNDNMSGVIVHNCDGEIAS